MIENSKGREIIAVLRLGYVYLGKVAASMAMCLLD